jgi:hypothetical protein
LAQAACPNVAQITLRPSAAFFLAMVACYRLRDQHLKDITTSSGEQLKAFNDAFNVAEDALTDKWTGVVWSPVQNMPLVNFVHLCLATPDDHQLWAYVDKNGHRTFNGYTNIAGINAHRSTFSDARAHT